MPTFVNSGPLLTGERELEAGVGSRGGACSWDSVHAVGFGLRDGRGSRCARIVFELADAA